jgi:hypothetical protein
MSGGGDGVNGLKFLADGTTPVGFSGTPNTFGLGPTCVGLEQSPIDIQDTVYKKLDTYEATPARFTVKDEHDMSGMYIDFTNTVNNLEGYLLNDGRNLVILPRRHHVPLPNAIGSYIKPESILVKAKFDTVTMDFASEGLSYDATLPKFILDSINLHVGRSEHKLSGSYQQGEIQFKFVQNPAFYGTDASSPLMLYPYFTDNAKGLDIFVTQSYVVDPVVVFRRNLGLRRTFPLVGIDGSNARRYWGQAKNSYAYYSVFLENGGNDANEFLRKVMDHAICPASVQKTQCLKADYIAHAVAAKSTTGAPALKVPFFVGDTSSLAVPFPYFTFDILGDFFGKTTVDDKNEHTKKINEKYYAYDGSVAVPPCSPAKWIIAADLVTVPNWQIQSFLVFTNVTAAGNLPTQKFTGDTIVAKDRKACYEPSDDGTTKEGTINADIEHCSRALMLGARSIQPIGFRSVVQSYSEDTGNDDLFLWLSFFGFFGR